MGNDDGSVKMAVPKPDLWPIPPIAKISYPGEEEAIIALRNVEKTNHLVFGSKTTDCFGGKLEISDMHWPWGAGMFATSLGPDKACFVMGANWVPNSGYTIVYGSLCAVQKEFIEQSKTNECRMGICGRLIWHFVHHTPIHLRRLLRIHWCRHQELQPIPSHHRFRLQRLQMVCRKVPQDEHRSSHIEVPLSCTTHYQACWPTSPYQACWPTSPYRVLVG